MARDWIRLPSYSSKDEAEKCAPDGWQAIQIEQLYEQLPVGKRFEQKTSLPVGRVPVIDQSATGIVGWHNEAPGVSASSKSPVVTFANHTCEMRLMERPFSVIQNVFPLVGRDNVCRTKFFYYLTKGRVWLEEYKGHFPDFRRKWILCPPYRDQERLTKVLGDLDKKISLNLSSNQTLEAMAQAIFQSWFVEFDPVKAKIAAKQEGRDPLRAAMTAVSGKADAELDALPPEQYEQLAATAALFPGEMEASELGEIPKGWSHKALLQLTDKIGSGSTPRGGKEVYLEEGVALIRSQNVYDSLFVWDGLARISDKAAAQLKGVTVQEEDVLLNITGASILRTCVVEPDVLPARVNQHVAIIRAKAGVPPRFIHMHLLRPDIKNYLLGLNAGASREAITKAHIESLVLLTPGPELLSAFQTAISPLFRQVHCLTRQMRALGELRDTLLPKLLSGELLVADAIAEAVA